MSTIQKQEPLVWRRPDETWSMDELLAEKVAVEDRMLAIGAETISIDSQIAEAQAKVDATGEYANRDWWRRVHGARKHKSRERQQCQLMLGSINAAIRQRRGNASNEENDKELRRFVSEARAMLPPETYSAIWARVKAARSDGPEEHRKCEA